MYFVGSDEGCSLERWLTCVSNLLYQVNTQGKKVQHMLLKCGRVAG